HLVERFFPKVLVISLPEALLDVDDGGLAQSLELARLPTWPHDDVDEDRQQLVEVVAVHGGAERRQLLVDASVDRSRHGKQRYEQRLRVESLGSTLGHDARGERGNPGLSGRVVDRAPGEAERDGDERLLRRG